MMQRTQQDHCKEEEALGRRLTHVKKGTLAKQITRAFLLSPPPKVK